MQYICKICGEEFNGNKEVDITKKFNKHLKDKHNLSLQEYIIQYYYNGEYPTCACGCGEKTKWIGKKALFDNNLHGFTKYCSCTHVNGIPHNHKPNIIVHYKCLECGKDFGLVNKSASFKILKHIKNDHNITLEEYCVKHYYNGEYPTCACGCGEKLKFNQKNALWDESHGFLKYVNCGHVARNNEQIKNKQKENYISKWNDKNWIKNYYYNQYGQDNIENSAKDFLENNDLSNEEIHLKYGIDIRTLLNIWAKLNLVTNEQWKERCYYRQHILSSKRRRQHMNNTDEICPVLYNIIKNFPQQYTLHSLIKYYNDNNLLQIEADASIVLKTLVEIYGEEIYNLLQYGLHSKEENEFIKVLKYLVHGKYKIGLRLQYGKNKSYSYIYDICINDKFIIEYDGDEYYHKDKEYDKLKEDFAINKGYNILRITHKQFKDPKTYIKINKWIKND